VDYLVETYPDALHGFAVPDMPVYNPNATERHWETLLRILGETYPPEPLKTNIDYRRYWAKYARRTQYMV
jgi:hypothetical protein